MNKEEILSYIDETITQEATYYDYAHLPYQISNAIYTFGSSEITDMIAFIDASPELDGSHGMILTPTHVYFQFYKSGCFAYAEITGLSLEKHRHLDEVIATIQTTNKKYVFKNKYINQEAFIQFLSNVTDIHVEMIMTIHEKIEYYIKQVIDDIENDGYEDIELTEEQAKTLRDLHENLEVISRMNDEDYCFELENICPQALNFFYELELDSDEIDILIDIEKQLSDSEKQEDQQFQQAQQYYDKMMNEYAQGNTQMYDQFKGTMDALGINEEEMRGKSPEELEQYVSDLCDRLGVSKSMVEKMAKKFLNK